MTVLSQKYDFIKHISRKRSQNKYFIVKISILLCFLKLIIGIKMHILSNVTVYLQKSCQVTIWDFSVNLYLI